MALSRERNANGMRFFCASFIEISHWKEMELAWRNLELTL